jgi:peptidyl-prolyl cis-trans isomerase SurA
MRINVLNWRLYLTLCALALAALFAPLSARAQNIVVLVNDEPITSFDVAQRIRWNALTGGSFGERMKSLLTGDAVNQKFRQLMMAANPRSQEEAQVAAERIKKEIIEDAKRRVLTEGGGSTRKSAIDALIEDKLKLQAAKKLDIKITDKEVEENLSARAGGEGKEKKAKLEEFYQRFEKDGINRKTIQEIIRAQLAWRDTIRRVYGPRIQSMMAAIADTTPAPAQGDIQFDVRVLKLAVRNIADQKAVGERMLEAENLKNKFTSCSELPKEATLVAGATVKTVEKVKLAYFPKDVQPLIEKASEGQMTPPVLIGGAVESYAVCRKGVIAKPNAQPAAQQPDARQAEYDRFSRSYLAELKQKAAIDNRGTE